MTRFMIYLLVIGLVMYLLSYWKQRTTHGAADDRSAKDKIGRRFRPKRHPREIWMQVYETESGEEARMMQARLQEQEIDCVVYEKGKKDIQGNPMKGLGLAVPKTSARQAQGIISRMPV